MADSIDFGWGAPPMGQQFPSMSDDTAERFDRDREALLRLHLRGYLTDSQRDSAARKVAKAVGKALSK